MELYIIEKMAAFSKPCCAVLTPIFIYFGVSEAKPLKLVFIRHAESLNNVVPDGQRILDLFRSKADKHKKHDPELTQHGRTIMQDFANTMSQSSDPIFDFVGISPLVRTYDSFLQQQSLYGNGQIHVFPKLVEIHSGDGNKPQATPSEFLLKVHSLSNNSVDNSTQGSTDGSADNSFDVIRGKWADKDVQLELNIRSKPSPRGAQITPEKESMNINIVGKWADGFRKNWTLEDFLEDAGKVLQSTCLDDNALCAFYGHSKTYQKWFGGEKAANGGVYVAHAELNDVTGELTIKGVSNDGTPEKGQTDAGSTRDVAGPDITEKMYKDYEKAMDAEFKQEYKRALEHKTTINKKPLTKKQTQALEATVRKKSKPRTYQAWSQSLKCQNKKTCISDKTSKTKKCKMCRSREIAEDMKFVLQKGVELERGSHTKGLTLCGQRFQLPRSAVHY